MRKHEEKDSGRTVWQCAAVRFITTFAAVAVMVMIFAFSAEDADRSNGRSGAVSQFVLSVIAPGYGQMTPDRQDVLFNDVQTVVRKCAHFLEYALLGLVLRLCLESWFGPHRRKLTLWAWVGGSLYSCTDELHQIMVSGRSGQAADVLIDSTGVLLGALIAGLILSRGDRSPDSFAGHGHHHRLPKAGRNGLHRKADGNHQ